MEFFRGMGDTSFEATLITRSDREFQSEFNVIPLG
jgi:hypothetical protein